MGQCAQVKKNGEQCKAQAVEGGELCAAHMRKMQERAAEQAALSAAPAGAVVDSTVAPGATEGKEAKVSTAVINKTTKRKIRFTGKGNYAIPSEHVVFTKAGQEAEVSYECYERLLGKPETSAVFEEA